MEQKETLNQSSYTMSIKYQKVDAYGEPVENIKDATCICLEVSNPVDDKTNHCACIMLDKDF